MKIVVALAFMLFLVGCSEKTTPIHSGIYYSSEARSEEKIEVRGSEIIFHIKFMNGPFFKDRQCDYSVNPDGRISLFISSNEWSILRYDWTFDGKVIWKEDIKTKQKVSFVKRE